MNNIYSTKNKTVVMAAIERIGAASAGKLRGGRSGAQRVGMVRSDQAFDQCKRK